MSQRWTLPQHSCKTLCRRIADDIAAEIEVSERWALHQLSCKPFFFLSFPFISQLRNSSVVMRHRLSSR
jgi:hypothetical protein